jgi:hypothetical protein
MVSHGRDPVMLGARSTRRTDGFYERGNVRIRYEESGSGFPLLLIAGGGLNGSTIAGIRGGNPFNTIEAFKGEFRCIYADLRNSADDHLALIWIIWASTGSWCWASASRAVHLEPDQAGANSRRRGGARTLSHRPT